MNIVNLLNNDNVIPGLKAKDKAEILNKMVDTLESQVERGELEAIRTAVFEREEVMSTGVGKGLAIPHGKTAGVTKNYASFAVLKDPIDYEAVDQQPVNLVFLLVGPQSSNNFHIKMLSRISRLMNNNDFRQKLLDCATSKQIIDVFAHEEEAHFGT